MAQSSRHPALCALFAAASFVGPAGYIHTAEQPGTVALYRCITNDGSDHFVSPQAGCEGHQQDALLGWAIP